MMLQDLSKEGFDQNVICTLCQGFILKLGRDLFVGLPWTLLAPSSLANPPKLSAVKRNALSSIGSFSVSLLCQYSRQEGSNLAQLTMKCDNSIVVVQPTLFTS